MVPIASAADILANTNPGSEINAVSLSPGRTTHPPFPSSEESDRQTDVENDG
jgi:hypothetical protein